MQSPESKQICCICKHEYPGFGHNAQPYRQGRCCNTCNDIHVIPARVRAQRLARIQQLLKDGEQNYE
jgi:hypothetical protein